MNLAVQIALPGGPEALVPSEAPMPVVGQGQLLVRQTAIGVNYLDVYFRNGQFTGPQSPFVTDFEGAGVAEDVGHGVDGFEIGDRIGYQLAMGGIVREMELAIDLTGPAPS